MFISSCLTIFQLNLKNSEILKIKVTPLVGFEPAIPVVLRLQNTCAKKTAENVFNCETADSVPPKSFQHNKKISLKNEFCWIIFLIKVLRFHLSPNMA